MAFQTDFRFVLVKIDPRLSILGTVPFLLPKSRNVLLLLKKLNYTVSLVEYLTKV